MANIVPAIHITFTIREIKAHIRRTLQRINIIFPITLLHPWYRISGASQYYGTDVVSFDTPLENFYPVKASGGSWLQSRVA